MAETTTFREFLDAYGRPDGRYPIVDLDTQADGLYWTWDGGAFVHTAASAEQRLTTVFGLGAKVITRCSACAAFEDGTAEDRCPCSGMAIYCPDCGKRARVRLPEVPTFTNQLQ